MLTNPRPPIGLLPQKLAQWKEPATGSKLSDPSEREKKQASNEDKICDPLFRNLSFVIEIL